MEEEIKAEFNRNGFTLDDEEEILKKCKMGNLYPNFVNLENCVQAVFDFTFLN